jgi:hypothetical protein
MLCCSSYELIIMAELDLPCLLRELIAACQRWLRLFQHTPL